MFFEAWVLALSRASDLFVISSLVWQWLTFNKASAREEITNKSDARDKASPQAIIGTPQLIRFVENFFVILNYRAFEESKRS